MSEVRRFLDVLTTAGNLALEGNRDSADVLIKRASDMVAAEVQTGYGKVQVWHLPEDAALVGPRVGVLPTGHMVFYGIEGRRILCTDPGGTPLHECEWRWGVGGVELSRARIQLDCRQWVGIRPKATEQARRLEIPALLPGQEVTWEDLRRTAAQAWDVPLEDVRYFYPDSSFERDEDGTVTIRVKKDGLYLLEDDAFERARFVSYMGAIPWARIDLLNVVELYQSTLPGTGGAAFDLIWGLCQDQVLTDGPIPLRYRGLPTFPSDQAYGLFCAFFRPAAPDGQDPRTLFMDTHRGYEIAWWPRPDPPWRYFDLVRGLCVTIQGGEVQKVTVIDDPVAVPYVNVGMRGFASCDRTAEVRNAVLRLRDGDHITEMPLDPCWGSIRDTPPSRTTCYPFGWRAFFSGGQPRIDPLRAWTAALGFPEGEAEVAEESVQLFVLEQIYDYLNQLPNLPLRLARIHSVLIHNFDPVCTGFIDPDNRPRRYTILYSRPEWAQKNAQVIWDRAAREGRLAAVKQVEFVPEGERRQDPYGSNDRYDLVYRWVPYGLYEDPFACQAVVREVARALAPMGLAFLVGPPILVSLLPMYRLRLRNHGGIEDLKWLPAMLEHLRIHPETQVNPRLTVALGEKAD